MALKLHCSLFTRLENGHVGDNNFPILGRELICEQRRFFWRLPDGRAAAPACFIPCEPLIVVSKLVIDELVDKLTQFNGTLGGVVPAVPPREIVTQKLPWPWLDGVNFTVYLDLECSFL